VKAHLAAKLWRQIDEVFDVTVTARRIEAGPLQGQHVIEVEPRPSFETATISALADLARHHGCELSFGKSPRRVLVIS
jgi:hypothetical protein